MYQNYLDKMFGDESKMPKEDWIKKACSKECKWLINPEEVRKVAWELLQKPD